MSATFVDRGGTFTDVVTWIPGETPHIRKVRSDAAVVGELAVGDLVFGTTVATNALLERAGVVTALLATEGLQDLPMIRHMARPRLFDPDAVDPPPLCVRAHGIPGRLAADGTERTPCTVPADLDLSDVDAVAVVLLHSHRDPAHEEAVAEAVRRRWPHVHVSLGHRVSPEAGYLARIETTLVDAAITPVLQRALERDRVPADARAIRSDGGLVPARGLTAPDAVLSGPAGGVLAVAAIAARIGAPGAVGLDMGGTSTDVCVVHGDTLPRRSGDVAVAGVTLRRDMLEVDTIAAGGGSILGTDGVRLTVGPQSAGADPGPQCYGRGGPPTLTDAAVLAGLMDPTAFHPPLDVAAVDLPGDADAFLSVARERMAAAIRRLAAARGIDPAPLALVAYGGAAGQHAAEVGARLGIRQVVVHPFASVLSAWGQTLAREEEVAVEAVWAPLDDVAVDEAAHRLRRHLGDGTDIVLDVRTAGTDDVLRMPWSPDRRGRQAAFGRAHRAVHGMDVPEGAEAEVVNVRGRRVHAGRDVPEPDGESWGLDGTRHGPCRVDVATTSVWVPEGWSASVRDGLLVLDHVEAAPVPAPSDVTPHGVAVWGSRLAAVAEQAGERLARLARSVNIRERRDFSCALFDGDGALVVNAPHIPVHLGAMGETVRDLLRHETDLADGSAWLTNDPGAGGSHLPDLTVVTPVQLGSHRVFVACRGHHVDVGGLTPGSMPPRSRRLAEEGRVYRRVRLTDGGRFAPPDDLTEGVRAPQILLDDLRAQVAANRAAAQGLRELGPADLVVRWMAHLLDAAEASVHRHLPDLPDGEASERVGGVPLAVRVRRAGDRLVVDLDGTGGPHPGNLNMPPAVARAAVLYALRVIVGSDLPLNEGALRPVDLRLPSPSMVSPPPGVAVVGGNVETSQRLVDLLLRAWGARAGSQGTMNNLTIGWDGGSHYETLGGGGGASSAGAGASCRQVHMTNTRATDPEVLEWRSPLSVERFARRVGSGGTGRHRGGDGLIRELELRARAEVHLLALGRTGGGRGLAGGGDGAPGEDAVRRDGRWTPWDGDGVVLEEGDRVRVATPGGGGWGDDGPSGGA